MAAQAVAPSSESSSTCTRATKLRGCTSSQDAGGDPSRAIVNVLVTEDVAGAETSLREIWGGPLCVAQAQHTETFGADLVLVNSALQRVG